MRAAFFTPLFGASLLVGSMVMAQTPDAQPTPSESSSTAVRTPAQDRDRHNQRIERIHHEDRGSKIDELRVGGETKSITVQPKTGALPAYEVEPARPGRDAAQDGTNGRRTWKALQF